MALFRKLSQRRRSNTTNNSRRRDSSGTSPPPSPPPGPPDRIMDRGMDNTQQSFSQIPLVYCDEEPLCPTASALPPTNNGNVAVGVPTPVATVCEVLGPDNTNHNTDAMSYADSYAVSTTIPPAMDDGSLAYSHATTTTAIRNGPIGVGGGYTTGYGYNNPATARSVSVGSYTTTQLPPTPPSPYGGGYSNNIRSTSGGYHMMNSAQQQPPPPPPPAPYGTPPSQIHVPASHNYTIDTSPTSVRSAYTTGATTSYVPGPPVPPNGSYVGGRRAFSEAALRSAAETTQSMTTSSGVQLQQLSMVNMDGRRMTPYVTKPRNNNTNNTSATTAATASSNSSSARRPY